MTTADYIKQLEYAIDEITEIAKGFGLDFYPMRYEICPADIIYTFGAYGMPTRFSHWSFGKSFHKMKMQYDFGLSKIYELVINSNPCYAFLLEGNSLIQNKLIVAHVLAHCDFFKNNARFSRTNRSMVETMSAAAERIRQYEIEYGTEEVEAFLDAVLAIQEHVDPSLIHRYKRESSERDAREGTDGYGAAGRGEAGGRKQTGGSGGKAASGSAGRRSGPSAAAARKPATPYDDLWQLDGGPDDDEEEADPHKFPAVPDKDLLWFIQQYAPYLKEWQRDILSMLREEMLYFWPQMETKIMNEGWASVHKGAFMWTTPLKPSLLSVHYVSIIIVINGSQCKRSFDIQIEETEEGRRKSSRNVLGSIHPSHIQQEALPNRLLGDLIRQYHTSC
ncbi:hypothetical protein J31TS4_17190 [Paenibacillus sp. J31TS4]|nr:SpoVR family protein [Paenibacillus sp. J31TS4]GIP38439.1 hypothetical protein J31TS4_17190 [Paenibacillus sp. J31TS4]